MITVNAAYIRAGRLRKQGVNNQALTEFENAMKNIKESRLSKSEKAAARQAAASKFEASGESSLTDIKQKFEQEIQNIPESGPADAAGLSTAEKAAFLDGSENKRASILASHYLSSDNIAAMRDKANEQYSSKEEQVDAFYRELGDMIYTAYNNPDYSEADLNDIILQGY